MTLTELFNSLINQIFTLILRTNLKKLKSKYEGTYLIVSFLWSLIWIIATDSFIFFLMSTAERKAVIKHADMNEEMQQDAIDCANVALEKFNIEKDIAAYIKKEFDKKYNPTWHCVVGRNFGSYVTHETKHFIYFYMGQVAVLLFKSGWSDDLNTLYSSLTINPYLMLNLLPLWSCNRATTIYWSGISYYCCSAMVYNLVTIIFI